MSSTKEIRSERATQAWEVMGMLASGRYRSAAGVEVDVRDAIGNAVARTIDYPPADSLGFEPSVGALRSPRLRVVDGTTLATARELAGDGLDPFILNFASAKNPGGGFLGGAQAQEESLARSSALYACIHRSPMYAHHREISDCLYTSWMIYSPGVPIVRDDGTGELLDVPWRAAFLTAPAPNARVVLERDPTRTGDIEQAMEDRIAKALAIAARHGHKRLVLGAWGCGVFGNDPAMVASLFERALAGRFFGAFEDVVFAVFDRSARRACIRAFEERFHSST
ncbi:hypothetical protein AKJ09_10806 [Labilithrix luteola]|uniref:Microbial-type PARG catalytic domain-containing protein n=1 Tax=Labilithrix luteola TaxID=1391654 RepID=A0A0K1QEI3_9BACT|nr:TIGR02452 family protein [Labilithrix luteola]AKV04143.1 hypothetical protein AKJ09_10806 [Labilithrix luteola]